jgi:rRNA maturation RNase YbeY
LEITFFFEDFEDPEFDLDVLNLGVKEIIQSHNKIVGDINYIFCSDNYLLEINRQYLSHDYFTDIITFEYSDKDNVSGDIFISIDRVKENGDIYGEGFSKEIMRVISHGILHLLGFKDGTEEEKREMKNFEDKSIMLIEKFEEGK